MANNSKFRSNHNNSGFTLIELLAVMVIILILSMMSFRVANYVGIKSRNAKVEADMHKWIQAFQKMHDFMGHYDFNVSKETYVGGDSEIETDSQLSGWFSDFAKGIPSHDPWGTGYNIATFDPATGKRWPPNDGGIRQSSRIQEYIIFSLGPDTAPGYKQVNDDFDDPEYPWKSDPNWNQNLVDEYLGCGNYQISEIGYGDDIVRGNCPVKRGFRPGAADDIL